MKKQLFKISLLLLSGAMILASCGGDKPASSSESSEEIESSSSEIKKIDYSFTFKNVLGQPIKGVIFSIDGVRATTDKNGHATLNASEGVFDIKVLDAPAVYLTDGHKTEVGKSEYEIVLESEMAMGTDKPTSGYYKKGDFLYDFTVMNMDGDTVYASDYFEGKNALVLNFWGVWCGYCMQEMPYLDEAYRLHNMEYGDDIEILGINNGVQGDTFRKAQSWVKANDYTFPFVFSQGVNSLFYLPALPTTMIVDRYGIITYLHDGAFQSTASVKKLLDRYSDPNYEPIIADDNGRFVGEVTADPVDGSTLSPVLKGVEGTFTNTEGKWPWVYEEESQSIVPTNTYENDSEASVSLDFTLSAGEVLALDYSVSSEARTDAFFALSDGVTLIGEAGETGDYKTAYLTSSDSENEQHTVTFLYSKDTYGEAGDDTAHVKNIRKVSLADVPARTSLVNSVCFGPRDASGKPSSKALVLGEDKNYHVGDVTGPIARFCFFDTTYFSQETTIFNLLYENYGQAIYNGAIYNYLLLADKSADGTTPLTQELATLMDGYMTYMAKKLGRTGYTGIFAEGARYTVAK